MKVTSTIDGNVVLEMSGIDAGRLEFIIEHFNTKHNDQHSERLLEAIKQPKIPYIINH